ncbi:MAG: hypothetical protein GY751_03060 [Bacteroidetes bacterium]|nr:hypothetical protein [Bacteroidota bacterium]
MSAQDVDVFLGFTPEPPSNPFTWDSDPSLILLDVNNNGNNTYNVEIVIHIWDSGGEAVAESDITGIVQFQLNPFQMLTLQGSEAGNISDLNYFNPDIALNQMLPPGSYDLCYTAIFNPGSPGGFVQESCQPFSIPGEMTDIITSFSMADPSSDFSGWDSDPALMTFDIQNNGNSLDVLLIGFLNGSRGLMAQTDPSMAPVLTLNNGNNTFNGPGALPVASMDLFDVDLLNTGILPAGDYDLCIDVINAADEMFIEGPICEMFTIQTETVNMTADFFINTDVPADMQQWDAMPEIFTIDINNAGFTDFDVKFEMKCFGLASGDLFAESAFIIPELNVTTGSNTFSGAEAFPFSTLNFYPPIDLFQVLPAGDYEICIDIFNAADDQLLSGPLCDQFTIDGTILTPGNSADILCPSLITPFDGVEIEQYDLVNTVFQWMPAMDVDPGMYNYMFKLVELLPGQSAGEALQNNTTLLEQYIPIGENIFIWPEDEPTPECDQDYAWTVTLIDILLGQNEYDCIQDAYEFNSGCTFPPFDDPIYPDTIREETDSLPNPSVPDEPTIPPESVPKACSHLQIKIDNGTKPTLGIVLEEPEKFKYPRAVALRAEGIDWDLIQFFCGGCEGGQSVREIAVRDKVGKFKWKLTGKGQLNSPYDLSLIDSLQNRLKEIEARLEEISERQDKIQEDTTTTIPDAIKGLEEKILSLEEKETNKMEDCDSLDAEIQKLESRISARESGIQEYNTQLEESYEEYDQISIDIDTLERYLDGEPGSNEKSQQDVIADIKENLDRQKEALQEKEDETDDRSGELQQEIKDAEAALAEASADYNAQKNAVSGFGETIRELESAQLADPDIRKFVLRKREWSRKSIAFIGTYEESSARRSSVALTIRALEKRLMRYATKNPVARDSLHASLIADLTALTIGLSSTCSAHSGDQRTNCNIALSEVSSSKAALIEEITNLLSVSAVFDLSISEQIDDLRSQIRTMTGLLSSLESNAQSKEEAYKAAVLNFSTELLALEEERNQLAQQVNELEKDLVREEDKLSEMRQHRLDDLDRNYQTYVEQLKGLRVQQGTALADWQEARDSISVYQTDTIHMNSSLELLKDASKECKQQLEQLQEFIKIANNKVDDLNQELTDLRKEAKDLEDEQEDLEKEKEKVKDELKKKLGEGKKDADGPLVYYIPPPLEEILQNEAKFDSLKNNVSKAESKLTAAYAEKESLQGKIVGEMEFAANELVKLKRTKDQTGPLESAITETSNSLKEDKTNAQQEVIDEYTELVDNVEKAVKKIDTIKLRIQGLVRDSVRLTGEIEQLKAQVEQELQNVEEKREALLEKMSQKEYEENLLKNAEGTHNSSTEDLRKLKSDLEVKRNELGRAQNDMTRASVQEDDVAMAAAQSEINTLKNEIRILEETAIPASEVRVGSASASVESAQTRVANAKEQADEAWRLWNDAAQQLNNDTRDKLIEANEKLKKITADLEYWRRQLMIAQGKLDQRKKEVTDKKDKTDELVNDQDDIKSKQASLDDMKKQLEGLNKQASKSKNEIEDAVAKKKKWIEDAEKKLQEAKDKLKKAKKDLREYLVKEEFEVVDHKVMIELKGRDLGVDKWRNAEGEEKLTKELKYPKDRKPVFENEIAKSNKPPEVVKQSICFPEIQFKVPDPFKEVVNDIGNEPRTIALMYKDGEPLWKEWPVIPKDAPRLSKDVIKLHTAFTVDNDVMIYSCATSSEDCPPSPPVNDNIVDLKSYSWVADGAIFSKHVYLPASWWEPAIIPIPIPEKKQIITATGMANEIAGDEPKKNRSEPMIRPGVMIEWTKSIKGKPDTTREVQARVVQGDHEPLVGEDVEFEVTLKAGKSEEYGFGKGVKTKKIKTDGDGYAKLDFEFGDGYAEFEFKVKWLRGSTVMQEEKFEGVAPLHLKFHKLGNGPPDVAWKAIEDLFSKGSVEAALNSLPDSQDEQNADAFNKQMHGIAGLLDGFMGFANEEKILFEVDKETIKLDPEEDETRIIGIARTKISGLPEDKDEEIEFEVTAKVEEIYTDVADPAQVSKSYSTKGIKEFYIGSSELPFLVEADEEFNPNEPFSGSCHLKTDVEMLGLSDLVPKEYILDPLKKITLTATGIKVEGSGEKYTAKQGKVTWRGAEGLEFTALNFECRLDSFSVSATLGADIGGNVKHATYFPDPIGFSAIIEPTGDFLGKLTNLPELEAGGFKLKQGSAFSIDMHDGISPGPLEKSFKGVLIHTAQMELPDVLSRRSQDDKPSELGVKDFYVGTSIRQGGGGSVAFGGEVSYSGTLFEIGYAGYNLSASDISLTFENNALTEGKITGEMDLPLPMAGKVQLEISKSGDLWSAKPETKNPVAIPRLGTTMTLLEGTGITWDQAKKLGTMRINAMALSKDYGEVRVDGFEINSAGLVKAENISVEKSIEFKGGFKMNLSSLSFLREPEGGEYRMELNGGMAFPAIGIEDITGKLLLTPGPSLAVEIADATIEFDKDPVTFTGKFSFSGREFKGQFDIGIKKVVPNGLSGLLIIGNTEDAGNTTYNYWYAELKAGTIIPLGQTGTAILEIGGGVGYNYNPPVGNAPGSPTNTDLFSFKAIVGAGNYPGNGNLFAGRLEMVLAAPVFTLYGKVWILDSEENIYGDGTLNLNWETPSVSGDLGMFIGLADAEGDIFMFKGKVVFMYSPSETYIKSEEIKGSVMKKIKGEGSFDITKEKVVMNGNLSYSYDDGIGIGGILKALIDVDVAANGNFKYETTPQRVTVNDTYFRGSWDVDLETPLGTADITSGSFGIELDLVADPNSINVSGSGFFEYDVWFYAGSLEFEVGYSAP